MDFIHPIFEGIGIAAVIIILLVATIKIFIKTTAKGRIPTTTNLAFSKEVLKKLRNIECLSGNNRIEIFACALTIYECLWQAKKKGASIWIREINQSERELIVK